MFVNYKIYKVISQESEDSVSYSIQYFAESIEKIETYLNDHAPALISDHLNKFKDRHAAFRTLLQEII